jgi:hypothetical protein
MKRLLLSFAFSLIFAASLLALPLTALIFQDSAKLTKDVATWNKQCGAKPYYDDACTQRRSEISARLGRFVALVNDELNALRDVSSDSSTDSLREFNGRRKIMELEVRSALHIIKCLGVPDSDAVCSAEAAAIANDKTGLEAEYEQTHAAFDGKWISIPVSSISPAPKNQ